MTERDELLRLADFAPGSDYDVEAHICLLRDSNGALSGYTADLVEKLYSAIRSLAAQPGVGAMREDALDACRDRLSLLREQHRQKMNKAGDAAERAAAEGDMSAVSINSTESERHREAFAALNTAIDIFDTLYNDPQSSELPRWPELAAYWKDRAEKGEAALALAQAGEPVADSALRMMWRDAGGEFYGPHVETGSMPEAKLLPFLRSLIAGQPASVGAMREALQYVSNSRWNENADLDDICTRADRTLAAVNQSDGSTEGRALQREGTQKPFLPDDHEGAGLCEASVEPGPSDGFKRGLDFAANWHEAEARHAKTVYSEMDRYSEDHEERSDWRSWKDKEDRHLYCAAVIRRLYRPSDTNSAEGFLSSLPSGEVEPSAETSNGDAIATALSKADWSGVSIGNKALIATAIERLQEDQLFLDDATDNQRLIDYIADVIGLPESEELSSVNFARWLANRSTEAAVDELAEWCKRNQIFPSWDAARALLDAFKVGRR